MWPGAAYPNLATSVADNDADPGEVVWTWISYEEDPTQGKDRPVVVLARSGSDVVVAQLTSKNHDIDREQEAHWGRYWLAIGSGEWDPQGRVKLSAPGPTTACLPA